VSSQRLPVAVAPRQVRDDGGKICASTAVSTAFESFLHYSVWIRRSLALVESNPSAVAVGDA